MLVNCYTLYQQATLLHRQGQLLVVLKHFCQCLSGRLQVPGPGSGIVPVERYRLDSLLEASQEFPGLVRHRRLLLFLLRCLRLATVLWSALVHHSLPVPSFSINRP